MDDPRNEEQIDQLIRKKARGRDLTVDDVRKQLAGENDSDIDSAVENAVVDKVMGMTFKGKKCKGDCAGHRAGNNWKERGKYLRQVKSQSFEEGYHS